MDSKLDWVAMPTVQRAAAGGQYGALLRVARTAAGLTLEEAGELAGYSASTLSRLETRGRRTWNVNELRHLASVFGIPYHLFGLSPSIDAANAANLSPHADEGGEAMRRRELLTGTVAATASAAFLPLNSARAADAVPPGTIEDVLFGRIDAPPISASQLTAQIAAGRADFRSTRYSQLARRLPRLLAQAGSARDAAAADQTASAHGRLAQAYNLATELLVKLHDNGIAWATADRALQAARQSRDPLVLAESQLLAATVMRRTPHRDRAQGLMLDSAQQLQTATGLAGPVEAVMFGRLLAAASYTAALHDNRDSAWALLTEASNAIERVTLTGAGRLTALDLDVYRISVSRVLGDYGAAVDYARRVNPANITSLERRARYWEDTALALHGRGRPAAAFTALLAAEKDSPQEIRYRPWAQQLTRDLMEGDTRNALPGIREFAQRVGAS